MLLLLTACFKSLSKHLAKLIGEIGISREYCTLLKRNPHFTIKCLNWHFSDWHLSEIVQKPELFMFCQKML